MMFLPFLMGMKNGGGANMQDLMSMFSGMSGQNTSQGGNPMMSMLMNMMTKQRTQPQQAPPEPPRKEVDRFSAIRNLSGNDVTEALKILLNTN